MGIPKIWGDIFGVAAFSLMLGLGRSLYSGKRKLSLVLIAGAVGAALCYLAATVSLWPLLSLLACGLTGFCTSMLWPGNLIVASDRFPESGVFIFALMAAAGDTGAAGRRKQELLDAAREALRELKFLGVTEEEAIAHIKEMRDKYWDATHNVYAYVLKSGAMRYSDDGEPGGTAGMPVLNVLRQEEVYNVCCLLG